MLNLGSLHRLDISRIHLAVTIIDDDLEILADQSILQHEVERKFPKNHAHDREFRVGR